ncbi:diguanylate cyclase [Shewanella fodinae]|uniref:Diguanylate cyclase (GGDEF)-like protein n=1 Tax=Shewanella fodinae TaxID=552357 RepID=A0A4R2FCR9_9GAMM|nr:diguanylate cyclase [Shewanella fodinae]TCN83049.1 diguanylate cyclase (GGDEF)-like protein [Shewanella fodinae]
MSVVLHIFYRRGLQLCIWLLLTLATAQASPLQLQDLNTPKLLDNAFAMLRDPSGKLSLSEVKQRTFHQYGNSEALHIGYTTDAVWLKLQLSATANAPAPWVMDFHYGYLDQLDAYIEYSDGRTVHQRNGFAVPPVDRAIANGTPAFWLTLPANEIVTVYIRVKAYGSMTLNATLYPQWAFHAHSNRNLLFQTIFAGMFLALWCYNMFLGLVLKQRPYLSYSAYLLVFGITTVTAIGHGSLYLWPLLGPIINHVVPTGYSTAVVLALLFARDYMATKQRAPIVDSTLKWAIWLSTLAALATVILPVQIGVQIMSAIGVSIAALMMWCGVFGVYRKIPAARYFLVGWICMLIGTAMVSLRNMGWLPDNFITFYGMQLGSTIEMLLLSLGLASRFNEMKRQKEAAQAALVETLMHQESLLEQKVLQRTAELEAAKLELENMVYRDQLTKLYNRNGLEHMLDEVYQHSRRQQRILALLLIDLDDFKLINDKHGHSMGDHLLQIIAQRLNSCAVENDMVARLGGDEFVLLSDRFHDKPTLQQFGQKVKQILTQAVLLPNGCTVRIGTSIGICFGDPHLVDSSSLLRRADSAMYLIKHFEKNDVAIDDMRRRANS